MVSLQHSSSTHFRGPTQTLGDVSLRPVPVETRKLGLTAPVPQRKPVSLLYYGPHSSFAPTYDSTNAQLSYQQTLAWIHTETKMKAHDKLSLSEVERDRQKGADPTSRLANGFDAATSKHPNGLLDSAAITDLAAATRLSSEDLEKVLSQLPSDAPTSTASITLQRNAGLLRQLQVAQWERLRRSAKRVRPDHEPAQVEAAENSNASQLLDSMLDLIKGANIPPAALLPASIDTLRKALAAPVLGPDHKQDEQLFPSSYRGQYEIRRNDVAVKEGTLTKSLGGPAKVKRP